MSGQDNNQPPRSGGDTHRIGVGMAAGAFVLILVVLTVLFGDFLESQRNPNQSVVSYVREDGAREVVLERNRYGHFVVSGQVNGKPVEFLVDTGASDVAVPAKMADRLGLERGAPMRYQTANGTVTGYATTLDRMQIGGIAMRNVEASINPGFEADSLLLGMSFLRHLEMTQRGDELVLSVPASSAR